MNLISEHRDINYIGALDIKHKINFTYEDKIYNWSDKIHDKGTLKSAKEILLEDLTKNYYLSKHSDWSVENEYRLLILDKNDKENSFKLLKEVTQAIKGIVLGVKASDSDIHIIHEIFELKDLNELGVINRKSVDYKFYEKYPRFYKEADNEIKPYKDEVCKCKECTLKDECDNYV